MKRPSFQFYPEDWLSNSNLRRCSHEEKGIWIDVMCLLHDQEEYGIVRWPLKEVAQAVGSTPAKLKGLVTKGVLKGADTGTLAPELVYVPRSGRRDGDPVTLIPEQPGPVWYSSRMVVDEYKRAHAGASTRFKSGGVVNGEGVIHSSPDNSPSQRHGERRGERPPSPSQRHGEDQGDGSLSPSPSPSPNNHRSISDTRDTRPRSRQPRHVAMTPGWLPSDSTVEALQRHGIRPEFYATFLIGEFRLYWRERGELRSRVAWDTTFRKHVERAWQDAGNDLAGAEA